MLGLGASLRLLDAAIKGDAAAHAGYESAGAMAAACAGPRVACCRRSQAAPRGKAPASPPMW